MSTWLPGDALGGNWIATVGGVLSGAATTRMDTWSAAALFAASNAVALTMMVEPGVASTGTSTTRSYGVVSACEFAAPETSKVTEATPTLSFASARIVRWAPGSAVVGALNFTTGAVRSIRGPIAADALEFAV